MKPSIGERVGQVLLALLKVLCYLLLFLGSQVLVMMPVAIAAGIQSATQGGAPDAEGLTELLYDNAIAFTLIANMLTLCVILCFYFVRRKKFSQALWLRPVPVPTLLVGASLAPGLYILVRLALGLLPREWMDSYDQASSGLGSGGAVGAVAIVIVAPVVEEVIFRGLIMTRLRRVMPGWLAVVLSAAVFGACHGHPVWFCYTFVLGALFALMDLRAESILPSIVGHVMFNSIDQARLLLGGAPETLFMVLIIAFLVTAVAAPILNRRAVAAIFRPAPKAAKIERQDLPGEYEFDPWDE